MAWEQTEQAQVYGRSILQSERLRLRGLQDADLPTLEDWWFDDEIMALQSGVVRPMPESAMRETFREWSANKDDGANAFCVEHLDSGDLVGHVALWGATLASGAATMGIVLGGDHQGKGYGVEAVRLMTRYGFDEMRLHRIEIRAWAYNTRALATYTKAGYLEEGRRREVVFHDGAWHDEVVLALLAGEWRSGGG
ncbi:MAG: GNAT family N-acetyltransferase [Nocardioidaceae bacterium]